MERRGVWWLPTLIGFGVGAAASGLAVAWRTGQLEVKGKRSPGRPLSMADRRASEVSREAFGALPDDVRRLFDLRPEQLQRIMRGIQAGLDAGLLADGRDLLMIPSYVTQRPSKSIQGTYYALDLGGTNFRVWRFTFYGTSKVYSKNHVEYVIPDSVKTGTGELLFGFVADSVKHFFEEDRKKNNIVVDLTQAKLGFTFSFGVHQTSLRSGSLIHWSKGFSATGVVGADVVQLLQQALELKGLKLEVTALLNDTVTTLIAHCYSSPKTHMAVILGTGTNAAYFEQIPRIKKWKGELKAGEMIINTEWGNFDPARKTLPITQYDEVIDKNSTDHGRQLLEKMLSGLYLGKIARLVLRDLVEKRVIFQGRMPGLLDLADKFNTKVMSEIESDKTPNFHRVRLLFEEHPAGASNYVALSPTDDECRIIQQTCHLLGRRAAFLSAAAIAAVVLRNPGSLLDTEGIVVAMDGSLYEKYPGFGDMVREGLRELLGVFGEKVTIEMVRDGSALGAALVAATAHRT